jgi:multidrug efflux system membrane fusion protein
MRSRRIVIMLAAVVAIAAVGLYLYRRTSQKRAAAQGDQAAQAAARAVPVTVANVQRRDVPIYLDGIGNVNAFKTVTVRSQVDGRLDQVLFTEGQAVKAGELLARIDPRPF